MRGFMVTVEEVGTRSTTVEIPDVEISDLDWPEAALLAHFVFENPNPIAAECPPPEPEPDHE
jgi:hypothetical protein